MRTLLVALLSVLAVAVSPIARADDYPSKPIRLVLGYPPGGVADGLARPLAQRLGAALGQGVVVYNRPGAQTLIAADEVAKSPGDGYTLYLMTASHSLVPLLIKSVPYAPMADFTPIALLGTQGYVLIAGAQQPFGNMRELAAYGKAHPNALSVGVTDATTMAVAQALHDQVGIDIANINYKGGGPLMNDVLGGQIPLAIVSPTAFTAFTKDARIRGLGVTMPARLASLPDVPTVTEGLGKAGFDVQNWFVLAAPAHLPPAVAQRLHREIEKILADPETHRMLEKLGIAPPSDPSPDAIATMMNEYQVQVGALLRSAGVKPE